MIGGVRGGNFDRDFPFGFMFTVSRGGFLRFSLCSPVLQAIFGQPPGFSLALGSREGLRKGSLRKHPGRDVSLRDSTGRQTEPSEERSGCHHGEKPDTETDLQKVPRKAGN